MSSGIRSPSAVERSAAAPSSPAVRQPPRRRITYVSIRPPRGVGFDPSKVGPRGMRPNRQNCLGLASALPVFEQSEAAGGRDRLAARARVELAPDGGDMVLDRSGREKQAPRDLRVATALGDECEDVELA